VAFASASGTPLAAAPDDWANGCAVLSQQLAHSIVVESYLDPETGRVLLVEVKPVGAGRTIEAIPRRWSHSGNAQAPVRSKNQAHGHGVAPKTLATGQKP
jgi:hypothetical protein